ncbi:hypothetical protein F5Y14DRAFT_14074 [Nemania sp. NC0429]|nr:hypothetical protein F5Y14DRAFT_14074 [Nemania sp. NC0429]
MDMNYESNSELSSDATAADTPTHSSVENDLILPKTPAYQPPRGSFSSAPTPGRTYLIRHRDLDKTMNVKDGRLSLQYNSDPQAGCYWDCVETWGWLGFRETVSGNHLGRNGWFGFRASAKRHLPWEWFVVVGHGDDGFYLQSPHWWMLRWVGIGRDGLSLVDVTSSAEAAVWEFVEV